MNLSVIILTYNEELHITRIIENVKPIACEVILVDCYSKDRTVELAESLGAKVFLREWPGNQAAQFNWALENIPIEGEWILRMDADEYLEPDLIEELQSIDLANVSYNGLVFPLKRFFLGKELKRAGKVRILRMFKKGKALYEARSMDEHLILTEGTSVETKTCFVDDNLNPIEWWVEKHIGYARREANELLSSSSEAADELLGAEAVRRKRKAKGWYNKLPLFWRAFAYFCYRYFFKLGFLDGKEGFLWHFLQGWWYRTLVDTIVLERETRERETMIRRNSDVKVQRNNKRG